jgi:DNA-binding response OmpR family regulator
VLRSQPATADIAILMLTAMGHEQDRQRGLALGIRAYLVKPFSPLQLLECVQGVLATRAGRKELHEQMPRR